MTYNNYSNLVYGFDAYFYIGLSVDDTMNIENGGGNLVGEVKLAGNGVQANYILKKNINENDPTVGLCSGEDPPLCMGDQIIIVDTTVWTENNGTSWTWIGDYSQLNYTWHIADVTNPCVDYQNIPISAMLFPLRYIEFCRFEDFS